MKHGGYKEAQSWMKMCKLAIQKKIPLIDDGVENNKRELFRQDANLFLYPTFSWCWVCTPTRVAKRFELRQLPSTEQFEKPFIKCIPRQKFWGNCNEIMQHNTHRSTAQ